MTFVERWFPSKESRREEMRAQRRAEHEQRKEAFQKRLHHLPPEERKEIERVVRRGRRILHHLKNLEAHNADILAEHDEAFFYPPSKKEHYSEFFDQGVWQSLKIFFGSTAAAGALALPRTPIEYGMAGFTSLLGAGLAWYSAQEWRQHVTPLSRKKVKERVRKKTGDRTMFEDAEGFTSEQSLRASMLDSDDLIADGRRALREELAEFQKRIISEENQILIGSERDRLLNTYARILEDTITRQENLLRTAPEYEALSSLLKEERLSQALGVATATSVLVAARGMSSSFQLLDSIVEKVRGYATVLAEQAPLRMGAAGVGTLIAILGGATYRLKKDIPDEEGIKRSMKNALTLAGQELEHLKQKKSQNLMHLEELKTSGSGEYVDGAMSFPASDPVGLTMDSHAFNALLEQAHKAVYDITTDYDFPPFLEHVPPTSESSQAVVDESTKLSEPEKPIHSRAAAPPRPRLEIPPELERPYVPPVIEAPSQEALLSEISKQTIKDRLIGDHIRLIRGDKKYIPTQEDLDQPLEETLIALARDEKTSRDVIESILFYDDMLIENLRAISPKETVVSFFRIDDFIQKLKEARRVLEKVLREKEEREAHMLVRSPLSPGAFRAFIPGRYGMGFFIPGEETSIEALKETLAAWRQSKEIGRISKDSLVRFLRVCYSALYRAAAQMRNPLERDVLQEKRRDVRAALAIVDSIRTRDLADPLQNERGFTEDLQALSDEYRDDQSEHPQLRDTGGLSIRIESFQRDGDYIRPALLSGKESTATEVSALHFSDSPTRYDHENQMVASERPVSVPTELIVGSFTARDLILDADREYVMRGASEIMEHPSAAILKKIFIDPAGRKPYIQLVKIAYRPPVEDGGRGDEQGEEYPVYLIKAGHVHVAMARLAGIPVIAEVFTQRTPSRHYPLYVEVSNEYLARASDLQGLESRGLISGNIPKQFLVDSIPHRAKIESMAIPGLLYFSPNGEMFFKLYEKLINLWPDALKKIKNLHGVPIHPLSLTNRPTYRKMSA